MLSASRWFTQGYLKSQMDFHEQLAQLCATPGVAGFEQPIAIKIIELLKVAGVQAVQDRIGNVIAHLPGPGPKVALFAHLDEVGLLVRKIDQNGFLMIERVGGTSEHVLPGQRVQIWTNSGSVLGVIGTLPQHLANSHGVPGLGDMYIDIGLQSRLAAEEVGIEVGSPVTYASVFEILNGRIASKALDDRGGCALLLQLAARMIADEVPADIHLVFAVQEETTLRGAVPAIYAIQPDYAIGVDATLAFDTPDLKDGQAEISLGGGVVFKVLDHIRGSGLGFISHPGLRRHLEQLAREHEIPFQREVVTGLTTAATPLPYVRSGLPVAGVSFPLRYSHSPVEVADLTDLENTLALLDLAVHYAWELS